MKAQAPKGGGILKCCRGGERGLAHAMEEEPADIRQCREYLRQLGFGPRELAVLDPSDSEDIARQLASELNLPMRNTLVSFVEKLVQDSKEPAKLAARADGQLASYVEWINSWGVPEAATEIVSEWVPPVGTKKLRPGKTIAPEEEREARQRRLLEIWTEQLLEELRHMDAPVLKKLESCLDRIAAERMLPGKTRATTVKRYVGYYRQWRQWLQEAKSVSMPGTKPTSLTTSWPAGRSRVAGQSRKFSSRQWHGWSGWRSSPTAPAPRPAGRFGRLKTESWRRYR